MILMKKLKFNFMDLLNIFTLIIFLNAIGVKCEPDLVTSTNSSILPSKPIISPNINRHFIHHNSQQYHHHHNNNNQHQPQNHIVSRIGSKSQIEQSFDFNKDIFINQSNNIYILAKYGQTVSLPCVIYRQRNQDLSNIHTIWHKLVENQRPIVLTIGQQQLKQDMRYRIKVMNLNKYRPGSSFSYSSSSGPVSEQSVLSDENDSKSKFEQQEHRISISEDNSISTDSSYDDSSSTQSIHSFYRNKYLIQNWQLEIRKLTYEDAGTYQCLLPLVKPITKNITLQVIPDLVIEPREGNFKIDDKIVIKCKATLKNQLKNSHHPNSHNLNQRQQKPNIHWYKENEIIKITNSRSATTAEQKIEIDTKQDQNENLLNSVLTIHNAKVDDSGKYKCIYDNIQEQVNVKVIYDHYEYKNYLTSKASNLNQVFSKSNLFLLILFSIIVQRNFYF